MKYRHTIILAALFANACPAMAETADQHATAKAEAEAKAEAKAEGNQSSIRKQSVTVTSDGKQTIKKTVTIRDGKEEIVTEITDGNGRTIRRTGGDDNRGGTKTTPDDRHHPADGPWLGVKVQSVPAAMRDQLGLEEDEGIIVEVTAPDSPAGKAGIRVNDIFLKLDDAKLSTPGNFRDELNKHKAGDTVTINILRKGQRSDVQVVLEERPKDDNENPEKSPATDGDGKTGDSSDEEIHVEVRDGGSSAGAGLDTVLDDPNVPESFKKSVREMKEKMRDFEKKHGIKGNESDD